MHPTDTEFELDQDGAGWLSGKALNSYSEGDRFESRSRSRLPRLKLGFEVFTAVVMKSITFWAGTYPEDGGDMFLRNIG
jgi:hypothetical protein